jgi:hypothetical protein
MKGKSVMLGMKLALFAQAAMASDVGHWAVVAIVVAGIVGILYVGLRQAGITIPPFVIQIIWIIIAVVACVIGIKFLLTVL